MQIFDPWSPDGSFTVQKMTITTLSPSLRVKNTSLTWTVNGSIVFGFSLMQNTVTLLILGPEPIVLSTSASRR